MLPLCYSGCLAQFEHLLGGRSREQMHHSRDKPRPSGLMACTESCPVLTVEILVEEDEIPPVRVCLEPDTSSFDRTARVLISQEDACQTP
jgi:hypothetical protein